jgi:hypothetical protein
MMSRARLAGGNYSLRGLSRTARYYSRSKAPFADARVDPYLKAIRKARPEGFLFRSSTIIQEVTEATLSPSKSPEEQGQIMSAESLMYFRITGWVESEITDRLDQVSYIGPLRERPQRSYVISGETPPDVGTRGQFAPEIVFRNRDARKRRAVSRWLAAFDLPPTVHFRDLGEGIFSLRLRGTKTDLPVNLADTGFGVSQVLPLIVQGTYGEEGGLIVAEQPEIHLNPRQQSKLADLFVEIASTDRGVLVETHSEHLVTRLRRLMADKKITSEQVALYFVEREGSESRVREIDIRDNGHIRREDWPRGFFEEGLREAVGLASSQLKRQS